MENHTLIMLKRVYSYNFLIVTICFLLIKNMFSSSYLFIALGLCVASVNLLINTLTTYKALLNKNKALPQISSAIRVFLVCAIFIFLLNTSDNNIFMFIGGYSLQFISIIMYSLELKVKG